MKLTILYRRCWSRTASNAGSGESARVQGG